MKEAGLHTSMGQLGSSSPLPDIAKIKLCDIKLQHLLELGSGGKGTWHD